MGFKISVGGIKKEYITTAMLIASEGKIPS